MEESIQTRVMAVIKYKYHKLSDETIAAAMRYGDEAIYDIRPVEFWTRVDRFVRELC